MDLLALPPSTRPAAAIVDEMARSVWEVREPESVSEWASKHRYLPPKESETGGLIDLDRTPYLREVMDSFGDPTVSEIVCQKASQVGFTTAMDTMVLWAVCHAPGPGLWIDSNFENAKRACQDRIEPSCKASPETARRLAASDDDSNAKLLNFDRMRMAFVGSGNRKNLRGRPCKMVFIDDFEVCEPYSYNEATQRVAAFSDSKIVCASPPSVESKGIAALYETSDRRFYAVPCPHCGHRHELLWKNLRWNGGLKADPDEVHDHAYMQCPSCKGKIENHHKPQMLREGGWTSERPGRRRRGYRINAFYSPFRTFGWCAIGFLKQGGRPDPEWVNGVLGLPIKASGRTIESKELGALAEGGRKIPGYRATVVPADVVVLTCAIDVQAEYIYGLVVGFSAYGLRAYYIDRFTLPLSALSKMADVERSVRERRYMRVDGSWQKILLQVWDTGHRAPEVYTLLKQVQGIKSRIMMVVKGNGNLTLTKSWWYSRLDGEEVTKAQQAGVQVLNINTRAWKDRVADAIKAGLGEVAPKALRENEREELHLGGAGGLAEAAAEEVAPVGMGEVGGLSDVGQGNESGRGEASSIAHPTSDVPHPTSVVASSLSGTVFSAFFLPPDVPIDVLEHLTSEHLVDGRWEKVNETRRNEAWDGAYYLAAATDARGIRTFGADKLPIQIVPRPSDDQIKAWGVVATLDGLSVGSKPITPPVAAPIPPRESGPRPLVRNLAARSQAAVQAAVRDRLKRKLRGF